MTKDEWTPRERAVLDSLPREGEPSPLLEERTVRALRDRGLLRRAHGAARGRGLFLSGGWMAVAAAVACAALVGAFALGQGLGARQTQDAMLAMHDRDTARETASVQQAGAAYVAALAELVRLSAGGSSEVPPAETAAALAALHQVADQMVRLAPDDPLAVRILQAFEQREVSRPDPAAIDDDQIIWF